jgi:hypothetical protein
MPQTTRQKTDTAGLTASRRGSSDGSAEARQPRRVAEDGEVRGFAASGGARGPRRKPSRRRSPSLSKADWGPLGKHPDLDAIVARQRLRLPLSGRLSAAAVNQAWKRCAAEHHPDRGGAHDTMQLVNGARDLLLGRGES